ERGGRARLPCRPSDHGGASQRNQPPGRHTGARACGCVSQRQLCPEPHDLIGNGSLRPVRLPPGGRGTVGGIIGIVPIHRRIGRRWIWSYLVVGSVVWPGVQWPVSSAAAAEAPEASAPPPLATGEPALPAAQVPGADAPT